MTMSLQMLSQQHLRLDGQARRMGWGGVSTQREAVEGKGDVPGDRAPRSR
jgi:hypothetical protein